MRRTALCLAAVVLAATACKPQPKKPGEETFDAADDSIRSNDGDVAHGNTKACEERAELMSDVMLRMSEVGFTGGKKNRAVSLTGDEFLVHCQHSTHGVAFLVHVPQLKRYKDDVRTELARLAWASAELATQDLAEEEPLSLGVGLRGAVFYGAVITGSHGEDPTIDHAGVTSTDPLFVFYDKPDAEEAPMPAEHVETVKALVASAESEA